MAVSRAEERARGLTSLAAKVGNERARGFVPDRGRHIANWLAGCETVTNDCDPKVVPTAQVFNNNLHVFAQKTAGDAVWTLASHGGKWDVKTLGK